MVEKFSSELAGKRNSIHKCHNSKLPWKNCDFRRSELFWVLKMTDWSCYKFGFSNKFAQFFLTIWKYLKRAPLQQHLNAMNLHRKKHCGEWCESIAMLIPKWKVFMKYSIQTVRDEHEGLLIVIAANAIASTKMEICMQKQKYYPCEEEASGQLNLAFKR